VNSLGRVNLIN